MIGLAPLCWNRSPRSESPGASLLSGSTLHSLGVVTVAPVYGVACIKVFLFQWLVLPLPLVAPSPAPVCPGCRLIHVFIVTL
jgi:hypothetical protein